jgi:Holliday junction resolvase RusA-like endonuclease
VIFRCTIPGLPHGQGRPRAVRRGAFVGVHERPEDRSWKAYAQGCYQQALFRGAHLVAGPPPLFFDPVRVEIEATWPCPKSAKKADRARRRPRVGKPDCDNLAKAVLDAANGVLWVDDAQVAELVVRRWVGVEGEAPRVEVRVEGLIP